MDNKFLIRKPRGKLPTTGLPAFVLHQDDFNDYGFHTLYRLSYLYVDDEHDQVAEDFIGPVKILKKGQTGADGLLLNEPFEKLDDDFCSVGTSLDYYERIHALPDDLRNQVLNGLRDIVQSPALQRKFSTEAGWKKSLFRDDKEDGYLELARSLLTGDFNSLPSGMLNFSFKLPEWPSEAGFSLHSDTAWSDGIGLPRRIGVLVGKNGSGKSTALARLARIALGTTSEREQLPLARLGQIAPSSLGFPRIVTVSFSPFDSFRLPGDTERGRSKRAEEIRSGRGRFSFIGLRNIQAELDPSRNKATGRFVPTSDADRSLATTLKSIDELASELVLFLGRIREKKLGEELRSAFRALLVDSPFADFIDRDFKRWPDDHAVMHAFFRCSTGHKIAALTTAGLLATLERSSLVLFDEPETHLHPPLLAALMHALREILEETQSYCVLATHSPLVVQESLAKNVYIVRRSGKSSLVEHPKRETYGESLGTVTTEVFGLNAESTDYHEVLDRLVEMYEEHSELEEMFFKERMSSQGRAYALAQRAILEKKAKKKAKAGK